MKNLKVIIMLIVSIIVFSSCGSAEPIKTQEKNEIVTNEEDSIFKIVDSIVTEDESSLIESTIVITRKPDIKENDSSIVENSSVIEKETIVENNTTETYVTNSLTKSYSSYNTEDDYTTSFQSQEEQEEYIVYKPSTHYIHKSSCHWVNSECYEITTTDEVVARKCSECNPDIIIVNEYVEPDVSSATKYSDNSYSNSYIDSYERQLLAEITWHEYGNCNVSLYEKARIVAGVMNRVNDSRFPNTVYGVLTQYGQFSGYYPNCCYPTQECYDAVDYYFSNSYNFGIENSWYGDGYINHFYYQ